MIETTFTEFIELYLAKNKEPALTYFQKEFIQMMSDDSINHISIRNPPPRCGYVLQATKENKCK